MVGKQASVVIIGSVYEGTGARVGSLREELSVGLSSGQEGNFHLLSQEPQTTVVHNATDGIKVSGS